ncbi:MAG: phage holin family protein [Lachnospiraceae bacterium]|nr:phage holin family protein [Lachnospiraceae bacterium]
MEKIIIDIAFNNCIRLVAVLIVFDTIFGVLRAIKEKRFNSCFGIDGAIRKVGMLISILFLAIVDHVISVNLIGFLPDTILQYLSIRQIGMTEFFAILFIAYEVVSIIKNMTLCGLPVRNVWICTRKFLLKYTDELPDDEGLIDEREVYTDENITDRN